ncbi:MAG TPA: cupin domain-containing protein [Burkholderiales bacterium]|jgi:50S ribosomal protein L16 3-hydroxylase|nr:cupin domain-containing protein [Burkholderiales bacterium]
MRLRLLGGLSPRAFLRRYWQKRPLFVPQALPGFGGVIDKRALAALAARDDVESRMVERRGTHRDTRHGPFEKVTLGKARSTLLVSGVNLHLAAADALLRRFAFVPQARLDDVMVSYATPGGGVGPHVDSYDVFLLQGPGRRRWRVVQKEYIAHPGDLLYLPPGIEHDGVALEECYTYSIGFRAPRGAELGAAFLDWLHERGLPDAAYRDPRLAPASRPARIPREMLQFSEKVLARIRWSRGDVIDFLGRYLSSPKPHVVFRPQKSRGAAVRLDPKTSLLYYGERFFINGEALSVRHPRLLHELADRRRADKAFLAPLASLIAEWQRAGYMHYARKERDD